MSLVSVSGQTPADDKMIAELFSQAASGRLMTRREEGEGKMQEGKKRVWYCSPSIGCLLSHSSLYLPLSLSIF